ncbi:uncharacterized protein [Nicotiana tomentosiformis]|uniref:uncharacterized protein n=1 Tax=Nicotiana tomentosiformis TaxID=4098 RepID=UPI00388CA76D
MAWISFPGLLPTFFVKETLFSLATAVGRPVCLDAATTNKTRPSCARVKVFVDLLAELPKKVRLDIDDEASGGVRIEWMRIQYDMLPKYCKECKLQGHDEIKCWRLHPEPIENRSTKKRNDLAELNNWNTTADEQGKTKNHTTPLMILTSEKVAGNVGEQWKEVRDNRGTNKNNKTQVHNNVALVEVEEDQTNKVQTRNKFAVLEKEQSDINENNQLGETPVFSSKDGPTPSGFNSGQIEDLDEVNSTKVLWSDAVEVKDDQLGKTKTTEDRVKKDNKPSSPGDRLAMPGLKPGSPGVRLATPGLKPGSPGVRLATPALKLGSPDEAATVNPNLSATGEILAYVDSVASYV